MVTKVFARAARLLEVAVDVRSGTGFDVHRFGPGDHVMLCGVRLPHEFGLVGHSDADVGIHALCDAIYGAMEEGDIGRWFPPSEARWKDADSARLMALQVRQGLESVGTAAIANVEPQAVLSLFRA